ncbi:MAG: phosphatidylglycerol lysyltransferase domain-containing protein [Candidatus Ozemobacteraceae bacterium]
MLSICAFPKQQELTSEFHGLISDLLFRKGIHSSDFAMYNLLGWYLERPPLVSRCGNHLIIDVEGPNGTHVFLPPLGDGAIAPPLNGLLGHFSRCSHPLVLRYVPKTLSEEICKEVPPLSSTSCRGDFDYLYDRQDLAELSGRRFHQKKNFVNRLIQEEAPQVELLNGNIEEAIEVLEAWYEVNPSDDQMVRIEHLTARRMLPRLKEIGGIGVLVRIEGRPVGIAVASPIHAECWVVTLEKADRQFKGVYQFLNWATANRIPTGVKLINRETDLDIEGLRIAKLSYHPVGYEEKFSLCWERMNKEKSDQISVCT